MVRPPSGSRTGSICAAPISPFDPSRRTVFTDNSVAIYAWPSRGGVIILEEATHVDFEFLGLSTTDPPLKRVFDHGPGDEYDVDPAVREEEEDALCQRLLLLGAKWWDSEPRYQFVAGVGAGTWPAVMQVEEGTVEEPTLRERRWVKVGWEASPAVNVASSISVTGKVEGDGGGNGGGNGSASGGVWVLDCDTSMIGVMEEDNMVPIDAGRLCLARSMEERCQILKGLGATFYGTLEDYRENSTYLRAWDWKWEGEVDNLVQVRW